MIDKITIRNIQDRDPKDKTGKPLIWFQVWDILQTEWKSVLFTWDNGVGKTTFLSMLLASLKRNNSFARGEWTDVNDFIHLYAWFEESDSDNDSLIRLESSISGILGSGIVDIIDRNSNIETSESQFHTFLNRTNYQLVWSEDPKRDEDEKKNRLKFKEGIQLYAKKYGVPIEIVYAHIILSISGSWQYLETDINKYGWMVPSTKGSKNTFRAWPIHALICWSVWTYFPSDDLLREKNGIRDNFLSVDSGLSTGLKTLELLGIVKKAVWSILILDEPNNWLAWSGIQNELIPTLKNLYTNKNQAFIASHDKDLIDQLWADGKWLVVKLPLNKNNPITQK